MALPLPSRTTTGTITRFTLALNVAGASCVESSALFCEGAFAWGAWPRPEMTPNNKNAAAAPRACMGELLLLHWWTILLHFRLGRIEFHRRAGEFNRSGATAPNLPW